jgi:hypothetical protein
MKGTRRLIASAPSREQLIKLLNAFFFSKVSLLETLDGSFDVHNSKGLIVGIAVRNHKGRWRAEVTQ